MIRRRATYVVVGVVLLTAHVLVVTVGFARVAPWLGGAAATGLLTALVVVHVEGARRLTARRRQSAGERLG